MSDLQLMTRFLRCTRLVTGGESPPADSPRIGEQDLGPWPGNEDGTRPEGRGVWSTGCDPAMMQVMAAIPQTDEEAEEGGYFCYRKFRVFDAEDNLIAEGDGIFHTGVDWSWTEPLGHAANQWDAAEIKFFEGGKWVSRS